MIKHVDQYPVSQIFSIHSDALYKIPKYQREYTWGTRDWDALFDDVIASDDDDNDISNNTEYFLGSYICVSTQTMGSPVLELIDGQQRFTSLTIMLLALYKKLQAHRDDPDFDDEDDLTALINLKNELGNKQVKMVGGRKTSAYQPKLVLQDQNSNNDDFRSLLHECGIIDYSPKPQNAGNRRIYKAFKHFSSCIDNYVEDTKKNKPSLSDKDILFHLVDLFNSVVLVGIEVDSHKDAYTLFESLNHRGVPLSAIDLIKNVLIAAAEQRGDADYCYEKWKAALSCVGDDYSVQERFFRHYYNAFREELNIPFKNDDSSKKYPLAYLATRTTLLDIYEKLIRHDYIGFIEGLGVAAQLYSIIVNNSEETKLYSRELLDLERIQGAPSYVLLLYLMSRQEEHCITDEHIQRIIKLLVTFFVRRNITDIPATGRMTSIFMDAIDSIKGLQGDIIVTTIHDLLHAVSAPESLFIEKLRGPMYDENDVATRFVLCTIESQHQTKEIYSDLWERDSSNKYVWTIEHIFPEGQNIPNEWIDMIADGDKVLAYKYHSEYVHTLGNLTITGYNSNLSNLSFDRKKNRKSKDGSKEIGYRNGLFLNTDVVSEDTWTIEKIATRTEALVATVLTIFKW